MYNKKEKAKEEKRGTLMRIQDILLLFPRSVYSTLAKMVRTELNEEEK